MFLDWIDTGYTDSYEIHLLDYNSGALVKKSTYYGQYNTSCTLTASVISRGHYYVQVISCYEGLLTDGEKREVIIDDQNNPVTGVKLGDADGDDALTILDATAIQRTLAKLNTNKNIGKPMS